MDVFFFVFFDFMFFFKLLLYGFLIVLRVFLDLFFLGKGMFIILRVFIVWFGVLYLMLVFIFGDNLFDVFLFLGIVGMCCFCDLCLIWKFIFRVLVFGLMFLGFFLNILFLSFGLFFCLGEFSFF